MCRVKTPDDFHLEKDKLILSLKTELPKVFVRGKFELWFFVTFLNNLVPYIEKEFFGSKKIRINTCVTESNAVEILGPRLQGISSLEEFLQKNIPDLQPN